MDKGIRDECYINLLTVKPSITNCELEVYVTDASNTLSIAIDSVDTNSELEVYLSSEDENKLRKLLNKRFDKKLI